MLVVDAGGNFAKTATLRSNELWQVEQKARVIAEAMAAMGIDAMTPGLSDFALGRGFLMEMAATHKLPYLACNLESKHGGDLFPGSSLTKIAGHSVGIIGVVPTSLANLGLVVQDPTKSVHQEVQSLKKEGAELILLLSSLGQESTKKLVASVPGIDFSVVSGSGRTTPNPLEAGDGYLVEAGRRGKVVGVLNLQFEKGADGWADAGASKRRDVELDRLEKRLSSLKRRQRGAKTDKEIKSLERNVAFYTGRIEGLKSESTTSPEGKNAFQNRFEQLSRALGDDPEIAKLIEATQARIEDSAKVEDSTISPFVDLTGLALVTAREKAGHAPMGDFVGAQTCKGCHPSEYDQWDKTGHANAYAALVEDHRSQDLQCFSCHITGHGKEGGPTNPAKVGYLKNVQCESCHTGGRAHVMNPTGVKLPAQVPEATCRACHTEEMTGGRFDYKKYLSKVVHSPVH